MAGGAILLAADGVGSSVLGRTEANTRSTADSDSNAETRQQVSTYAAALTTAASTTRTEVGDTASPTRVKVAYFQMDKTVGVDHEYYDLAPDASLRDLLTRVVTTHPGLSSMLPSMMVLVNGRSATPDSPLSAGDEVDLIPAYAGG